MTNPTALHTLTKEKRIIAIMGSDFSATTAIGCMLGSTRIFGDIIHVGEYFRVFREISKKGRDPRSVCVSTDGYDKIWKHVLVTSPMDAYERIFETTAATTIVDSSKSHVWFRQRMRDGGWDMKAIICWQDPIRLAYSCWKRNFSLIDIFERLRIYRKRLEDSVLFCENKNIDFICVRGADFVSEPAQMAKQICQFVDVEYFAGKENYWKFEHHHLSGNPTQWEQIRNNNNLGYKPEDFSTDFDPTLYSIATKQYQELIAQFSRNTLPAINRNSIAVALRDKRTAVVKFLKWLFNKC